MTRLEIILHNVEAILKARKKSANKAAIDAGVADAIRNMQRKVRKGILGGSPRTDTLMKLAAGLNTDMAKLTAPPAKASEGEVPQLREFLLAQRALIDHQLASIEPLVAAPPRRSRRKKSG